MLENTPSNTEDRLSEMRKWLQRRHSLNHQKFQWDGEIIVDRHAQALGAYLRASRENASLTQEELALITNLLPASVLALEHGVIPTDEIESHWLDELADALGEDVSYFYFLVGRETNSLITTDEGTEDVLGESRGSLNHRWKTFLERWTDGVKNGVFGQRARQRRPLPNWQPVLASSLILLLAVFALVRFRHLNSEQSSQYIAALSGAEAAQLLSYEVANHGTPLYFRNQILNLATLSYADDSDGYYGIGDYWYSAPNSTEAKLMLSPATVTTAELSFKSSDPQADLAELRSIIDQEGKLLIYQTIQTDNGQTAITASFNVPPEHFDSVLAQVKNLSSKLISETVTSRDVTGQYRDLDARLRNSQLTESELQDLLESAQERGDSAEEILSVHERLSSVRQQVEQLQAEKATLENSVATALITVIFQPEEVATIGFGAEQIWREAWATFVTFVQWLADKVIWALAFSPYAILVAVAMILVWRILKNRNRNSAGE